MLEESAANCFVYNEIFLSPTFCGAGDPAAWIEHVAAIREAADAAERQSGITLRGIVTPIRHQGPDKARQTAICAAETAGGFIIDFGLIGDEAVCNPNDFHWSFDCAREAGLTLMCDAGERRGPAAIREALDGLGVQRIGRARRVTEDMALVEELAERRVVLDLCPGADTALDLCRSWRVHPAGRIQHAGLRITLSTDCPAWFGTTMTESCDRLAEAFGWDEAVFDAIAKSSLEAAFCDSATRAQVQQRLEIPDA